MSSATITVIVPRLPPSIDGLGDYGMSLARQLRSIDKLETHFIVADPAWSGGAEIEGFKVTRLKIRNSDELLKLLPGEKDPDQKVLLHYVGYGYARRGSPVWLIKALSQWKSKNKKSKLVTMFHEMHAPLGPVWTSQFWTFPLQRYLVAELGKITDHCLTSKKTYAEMITKFTLGKHSSIPVLPVFSNVGEPENYLKLSERKKRIVIFGSRIPRARVYKNSFSHLEKICSLFGIEEIFDIGAPLDFEPGPVNGIKVKFLGIKPSEEISRILSESMIGLINYPTEYLAKSGIFAAYCAHGVLCIADRYDNQKIDSVSENMHYWIGDMNDPLSMQDSQRIADNAYNWYQGHRLSEHGKAFSHFLK